MIGRLNHVGVATPSIEKSVALYRDVLGATKIGKKFAMAEQGVWVCFVDLPNAQIELIEPYDEKSPIVGFLKKNPNPTREQLAHGVSGNLCRCQDYDKILTALERGAALSREVARG